MSLKYFVRYQFGSDDPAEDDFRERDLAVETGTLTTEIDPTYGKVLLMDGLTGLMSTGSFDLISGATPRSFSFWAKTNLDTSPLLSYGELSGGSAFVLYANNVTNNPEVFDYTTSNVASSHTNASGVWSHYVVSYDGSTTLIFYVDGALTDTLTTASAFNTGTTDPFRIGTDGLGDFFNGSVSDLRVYDHALPLDAVTYMFSVGPNYEEKIDRAYVEEGSTRGFAMSGTHISNESYGVHAIGNTLSNSYFAYDTSNDLQESARIEYSEDVSGAGVMDTRVRHTDTGSNTTLFNSIKATSEATTFSSIDATDTTSSVVFSSEGVSITSASGDGGLFFGSNKDFRISVIGGGFTVAAYNSTSGTYVTKMNIDP